MPAWSANTSRSITGMLYAARHDVTFMRLRAALDRGKSELVNKSKKNASFPIAADDRNHEAVENREIKARPALVYDPRLRINLALTI